MLPALDKIDFFTSCCCSYTRLEQTEAGTSRGGDPISFLIGQTSLEDLQNPTASLHSTLDFPYNWFRLARDLVRKETGADRWGGATTTHFFLGKLGTLSK